MKTNLVVVESPTKAKTILKYLGDGFRVLASGGHIKDLPKSRFGVNIEGDFQPEYSLIKGKGGIVKEIREAAAKSEAVYLAPDPDREGEAIAWHIAQELPLPNERIYRVAFNEITASAVQKAFEHPGRLDQNKMEAQQARRILDRIVGYRLSPILWRKVKKGLSAGRVQSVALRLICEREEGIGKFVSREYWTITAMLKKNDYLPFAARLEKTDGKKAEIITGDEARRLTEKIKRELFVVEKVKSAKKQKKPPPPFTTSQMQQEAYRRLGFTARKTMTLAQRLYEGVELPGEGQVALTTYIRTDSTRVAKEAQEEALKFIEGAYGPDYRPKSANIYRAKKKGRIQDAHECIRPTSVNRHPDRVTSFLDRDLAKLYKLIWSRFVASQMKPSLVREVTADIQAGNHLFRAKGTELLFDGFRRVIMDTRSQVNNGEEKEEQAETILPPLQDGDPLLLEELSPKQNFTSPPPRYTEASLIRTLEEKGIGRPSTYATILTTIQARDYTRKEKGRFQPTELGLLVNGLLVQHFPEVLNVRFTASMEDELDMIEEGQQSWIETLRKFYDRFKEDLDRAVEEMKNIKREVEETDIICDKCGRKMVIRWGKRGRFLACSGFPECKNSNMFKRTEDGRVEVVEEETTDISCDQCGRAMAVKEGRYGKFLACSGFPECKNTRPLDSRDLPCPREGCTGRLVPKMTKKKRRFFGCNRYPSCKFATWHEPVAEPCPACGSPVTLRKGRADNGETLYCPRPDCQNEVIADPVSKSK